MTIAYFCIIIHLLMTYGLAGIAKFSQKGYDNEQPRNFLNSLKGKGQRALWAHQNSMEANAPFFAGVIIAHLCNITQTHIDLAAILFCLCRLVYAYFYISNQATKRSLSWGLALLCNLFLLTGGFFYA